MPRHHEEDEVTIGEAYRAMRQDRQQQRAERLPGRVEEILLLSEDGFSVKKLTVYHYRVNGRLDLFPTRQRWHDIKQNRRGWYSSAHAIASRILRGES